MTGAQIPTGEAATSLAGDGGNDAPIVDRRGRAARRLARRESTTAPDQGVIVSRGVLGSRADGRPQTSRERKVAGDLPSWDLLPPGELHVRRGSR